MKVLLDIKDSKVPFVMELLDSLKFVKVKPLSDEKAVLTEDIKEAVNEMNLIKQGKIQGIPARELLNEL